MEKNLECSSATDDLLSQSYSIAIQKIAGVENDIFNTFRTPEKILEERKKSWINFFEKYSSMVSDTELNINTLQLDETINPSGKVVQRLPMRKPMSMVQHWVDTGNLLSTNNTNNSTHSDSGSSIVENDCLEPAQNIDSQSLSTDHHVEKHSNIAEISGNKNLKIATSSNSSIDTAAYILANNNVTKKAETIAIVEGSKIDTETQCPTKAVSQVITTDTKEKISLASKKSHKKSEVENTDIPRSFISQSYFDKITQNLKNFNFDKTCKTKTSSKSKQQESNICSIFFSDSDESQIINIESNQISNNASKFMKRKKLYNRSESPAEFTPVSEDNLSLQTTQVLLRKCLPLKKSEHPALETPKTSSKFPFRTRCRQIQFKRKLNHPQSSSLISSIDEQNEIQELHRPSQTNILMLSQTTSKDHNHIKEGNDQNKMNNMTLLNQANEVQKPFEHIANSLSSCNVFLQNKLNLKPCKVVIQRLSPKYYLSNSLKSVTKNKNSLVQIQSTRNLGADKIVSDYALLSKLVSTDGLSENNTSIKNNNVKTFNNTKTFRDALNCREKNKKLSYKTNSDCSPDKLTKRLEMTNNGNLDKTRSNYMLVDSSSDESDVIVPLSRTKNQSVSITKSSTQLSKKNLSQKTPKKKIVKSLSIEQNDDYSNTSSNEDVNKTFSKKQERHTHFQINGITFIHKNKVKNASSMSEEEILSKPPKEKRQVDLSVTKSKKIIKSTSSPSLSGFKKTSNNMKNCRVLLENFHQANDKENKTKKAFKLVINSKNSEHLGVLSNSRSDSKLPYKAPWFSNYEDSPNVERNKLSPTKRVHRQDKSQKMVDSTKLKTVIIQKAPTKKRKSFEIDLSSDEECIVPLKKKE